MKNLLLITYVFPPVGGAGVQRTLKWTKYLPEFGWRPFVLTAKNPSVPIHDEALEKEIPSELSVIRTRTFEAPYKLKRKAWNRTESSSPSRPSRIKQLVQRILNPDPQITWSWTAYRAALRLIKKEKIDAILTSAPPFSTHLLGQRVAEKSGLPWIADFRDEWIDFYTRAYDFHRRGSGAGRVETMERDVVTNASALVTVTKGILANYRKKYSKLKENNSFFIPNGYDPTDFSVPSLPKKNPRFTLVYTGTVFEVTSARHFLSALRAALIDDPSLKEKLRVQFVGRIAVPEQKSFQDPIFSGVIEAIDYLPHDRAIVEMRNADALLLLLSDLNGADRILTGKIFEYLACRKPILAIVPDGEAASLVRECHAGEIAHPKNETQIRNALSELMKSDRRDMRSDAALKTYDRRATANSLASVLDSCLPVPKSS